MKLQVDFTQTSFPGIPPVGSTLRVYVTPSEVDINYAQQNAVVTIDALTVDGNFDSKLPDDIVQQRYVVTNWTAINNALEGGSLNNTIQAFIWARMLAIDPDATIVDMEA